MKTKPTLKQIEKLRIAVAKFGMDFDPVYFYNYDALKIALRWSKSKLDNPTKKQVRQALEKAGCHSIEHLRSKMNIDWLRHA